MNRREWLRKAALLATGAVAADQLEILDRLGWTRTMFPSAGVPCGDVAYAFESDWHFPLDPKYSHKVFNVVMPRNLVWMDWGTL